MIPKAQLSPLRWKDRLLDSEILRNVSFTRFGRQALTVVAECRRVDGVRVAGVCQPFPVKKLIYCARGTAAAPASPGDTNASPPWRRLTFALLPCRRLKPDCFTDYLSYRMPANHGAAVRLLHTVSLFRGMLYGNPVNRIAIMYQQTAGARFEYREQESERVKNSLTLSDKFRQLKSLTVGLGFYNSEGVTKNSQIKYEPNLAKAKSVFRFDCPNKGCIRGDFDLTEELATAVAEHRTHVTGELQCQGWQSKTTIDTVHCHNILRYTLSLAYFDCAEVAVAGG